MTEEMLQNQVDEIRHLLETQLRAKGRTLEAQLRKAGPSPVPPKTSRRTCKVTTHGSGLKTAGSAFLARFRRP